MRKFFTTFIVWLATCLIAYSQQCSPPVINSFSPTTAYIGSTVKIIGANFDPIPSNNQVFFGSTKATIISATFSSLEVRVPVGATYAPISIKNNCGLYGVSKDYFNGIFCGTQITNTTYNTVSYSQYVSGGYQMISQDIDLDGKPDILVTGYAASSISVVRNLSTPGNVSFAPELRLMTNGATRCIAPGDFDGDGKVDLAVTVTGYGIYIFKNNSTPGNLSFATPVIYNPATIGTNNPYQMAAGDLNGDGKMDLVFGAFDATIRTLRNTSSGSISFSPANSINNTYAVYGIAIADLDNDGVKDIATSCGANDMASALRNTTTAGNTTFTFQNPSFYPTNSGLPYRMFVGDFDKDGKIDLASNNHSGGTVSIFRNTSNIGAISFAPRVNLLSPSSNYRIGIGDADGDGSPDIVTKSSGEHLFSVYKNTSGGAGSISFATRVDYPGQAEVSGVVIADFDGDYVPDIATSGISYNTLRVHRNTSTVVDNTPPTAVCRNITVPLGTNGKVTVTPQMIDNGSGDACGIAALTINDQPSIELTCNNEGRNTVTLKVTDRAGNSSTCTAVVTVAPAAVIVAGQTTVCQGQTVALSANEGDTYQWAKNGVDIPAATSRNYIATESGSYTVAVTNGGGCSGTSAPVQITVNNNPTVSTTPTGTAAMCNGSATLTASTSSIYQWKLNGNNIGGATQQSYNATAPGTYSVTVVDLFGCSATSDPIEVTNVNTPPIARCKNITVSLSANESASITAASIDNGSFDNCGAVTLSITSGKTTFNCSDIGQTYDVELTVTDAQGAKSTCIAKVTVADPNSYCNMAPVVVCKPLIISTDASCRAIAIAADFDGGSTDPDGDALSFSIFPAGPFPVGVTNVTLTATDSKGAKNNCSTTITVVDNIPPVITCLEPLKVNNDPNSCGAVINYALPTVTDNCSVAATSNLLINGSFETGSYSGWNIFSSSPSCGIWMIGTAGQTLSSGEPVTNYANNTTQSVTYPQGLPVTFSPTDGQKMAAFFQNCAASIHHLYQDVVLPTGNNQLCFDLQYRNFASDFSANQYIAVEIRNPSTNAILKTLLKTVPGDPLSIPMTHYCFDLTEFYGQNVRIQMVDANISTNPLNVFLDNVKINGNVSIVQTAGLPSGALFPVGTTTNTFEATDAAGNKTTCSFDVTVTDTEAPTVTTRNITVQLNAQGNATITPAQVNNGSADNCSIAEDGYSLSKTNFDCSNVGENQVTLTVTDIHGNTATGTAIVTIEDKTAPTVLTRNITIQLDEQGVASITPARINAGSTDNCAIPADGYSLSQSAFDCSNTGVNTVTLTVTDEHGNSSSAEATVTVEDVTAPVVTTRDITIQLNTAGQATVTAEQIDNGSSDACGVASVLLSKTSFDCSNIGSNTVTLTVTDNKGNTATGTAIVTVQDNVAPTAVAQDITVQLDATGNVSITPEQVNNGSADNCAIASVTLDKTGFNCSNTGDNTVTLTVTDVNGNVSTATATVTVEDKTDPVVVTKDITIQLDASGNATVTSAQINDGSNDACGIRSMTLSKEAFTCANIGSNTVTLTVVDNNGNIATATATVTVEDKTAPVVRTRNITVPLLNGTATITAAQINNGSSDACGIRTMSLSKTSFGCGELGNHTVTLSVTDVNGNTSTNNAVVTIEGVIPSPAITVSRTDATYTGPNMEKTIFLGYGAQSLVLTGADAATPASTQYTWTPAGFLSTASGASTIYTPDATQEGDNTFTVMATNQYGCTATANVTIKVVDARCGGDFTKINMCHVAGNDATHLKTICIDGGSVADHLAKGCRIDACPDPSMVSIGAEPEHLASGFTLKAMPNPSTAYFTLKVESSNMTEKVSLRVLDIKGRLVEARNNLQPNQSLRIGDSYRPGIYFIEVIQGVQRSQTKLIKMSH